MEIIDSQIHSWEHARKPHWFPSYRGSNQASFPIDATITAMDAVGVDAAVLDVVGQREDGSIWPTVYGEWAAERFPARIASILRYDHKRPDIAEVVAGTRQRTGVLAIRVQFRNDEHAHQYDAGEFDPMLIAAEKHRVPVMLNITGQLPLALKIARRFTDAALVIDHLGLPQPPSRTRDEPPFKRIDELLALAKFDNVSVKFIGAPAYSNEPYPYLDVWPHLHRIIDAFGIHRLMWGSDFTRLRGKFTYAELLHYLRYSAELSESDKALIFGANLRRILRWPRAA